MSIRELENIKPLDAKAMSEAEKRWLSVVKPLFSLGRLEKTITQIAGIKGKSDFTLDKKALVIMCADNGVVSEGISQCGSEVTATVAKSFLEKKSTVCIMAERANVDILPIDAGMASDVNDIPKIKVSYGTKNIATGAAMSREECVTIIKRSIELVGKLKNDGYDLLLTGEMGIGNTTTAAASAAVLLEAEAEKVTGKGAGLDHKRLIKKINVVKKSIAINAPDPNDPIDIISKVGGFDIAAMTGLFLGGAVHRIPIIMDGLISSVAALSAVKMNGYVKNFIIPSHLSNEPAGKMIMNKLGMEPFLTCGMFLGEGSGAVAVVPVLDMALDVYKKLGTFDKWEHEAYKILR